MNDRKTSINLIGINKENGSGIIVAGDFPTVAQAQKFCNSFETKKDLNNYLKKNFHLDVKKIKLVKEDKQTNKTKEYLMVFGEDEKYITKHNLIEGLKIRANRVKFIKELMEDEYLDNIVDFNVPEVFSLFNKYKELLHKNRDLTSPKIIKWSSSDLKRLVEKGSKYKGNENKEFMRYLFMKYIKTRCVSMRDLEAGYLKRPNRKKVVFDTKEVEKMSEEEINKYTNLQSTFKKFIDINSFNDKHEEEVYILTEARMKEDNFLDEAYPRDFETIADDPDIKNPNMPIESDIIIFPTPDHLENSDYICFFMNDKFYNGSYLKVLKEIQNDCKNGLINEEQLQYALSQVEDYAPENNKTK